MIVRSGSATLAVEVVGAGPPDVLLIHAGVTDQRSWHHVVERLRPYARCITYDVRGFGRTTYDEESGWSAAGDATAVLDHLEVERAVVVGASMGGRIAIDLALAHPELVKGLALIGPAVSGAPAPVLDEPVREIDRRLDRAAATGDLDAVNRGHAHVFLDGALQPVGRVRGAARDLFLEMNAIALTADDPGPEAEGPSAWDQLDTLPARTLVLVGEHDLRHIRDNARHLDNKIPDARFAELPGTAHLPHLEGDDATLDEIERFVRAAPG